MSYSHKKEKEDFRDNLIKSFEKDLFTDARLMKTQSIGRMVDHEAINKCRLSRYAQQSRMIRRLTERTGDYDDMQKLKDRGYKPAGKAYDPRDFDLDQNICEIFFREYGENFYGGDIVTEPSEGYTCKCGMKMLCSMKSMPERCPHCNRETPLGQLYKDKVLKRI